MDDRSLVVLPGFVIGAIAIVATAAVLIGKTGSSHSKPVVAVGPPALNLPYGPVAVSSLPATGPPVFLGGATNAAAVDATGQAALAVSEWLTEAGVPSAVMSNVAQAQAHPMIVDANPVTPADANSLSGYAARGGVVILTGTPTSAGGALARVTTPVAAIRTSLLILPGGGVPQTSIAFPATVTTGYQQTAGVVARFADGTAAIAVRRLGQGVVVSIGVPLEAMISVGRAGQVGSTGAEGRDALAALARALYSLAPNTVTLGAAPQARSAVLVLEHPLDTAAAYRNAAAVAAVEADRGVTATFFASTGTSGAGPQALLTPGSVETLRGLGRTGFDVETAGVQASGVNGLGIGSGGETAPGYAPAASGAGATLFGEMRVGRFLIGAVTGQAPSVFQPAVLAGAGLTGQLDVVAAGSGLRVDAAFAGASVGGTTPYRPLTAGGQLAVLVEPVSFDEHTQGRADQHMAQINALVEHALATGAPVVIRISPSGGSVATFAIEQLLAIAPGGLWPASAASFASFWDARYGLGLEAARSENGMLVRLASAVAVPPQTLQFGFVVGRATQDGGSPLAVSADGHRVSIRGFRGRSLVLVLPASTAH